MSNRETGSETPDGEKNCSGVVVNETNWVKYPAPIIKCGRTIGDTGLGATARYAENNGSPRSLMRFRTPIADTLNDGSVDTRNIPSNRAGRARSAEVWPEPARVAVDRPTETPDRSVHSRFTGTAVVDRFAIA